jgi:hypothetical protein
MKKQQKNHPVHYPITKNYSQIMMIILTITWKIMSKMKIEKK